MTLRKIPLLIPIVFLVLVMMTWAHTICPEPSNEEELANARETLKYKEPNDGTSGKILEYTGTFEGKNWRPDENLIAFIKSVENHPLANGKVKLRKYKDFGYIAQGYGTRAKYFKKHTVEEAEQIMIQHLIKSNQVVDKFVKVELNHHQRNALVSLVYNIGPFAFSTSKALRALNSGNIQSFKVHAFDPRKGFVCAGGKHNKGLRLRRSYELQMWDKGEYYSQLM